MEIIRIFGPSSDPDEGLWALKEPGESLTALERIFADWQDLDLMVGWCSDNLEDLQAAFGFSINAKKAANQLMDEADDLERLIRGLATKELGSDGLQMMFKPLHNLQEKLVELQLSKGSIKNRTIRNPKLRVYAVRIEINTFVVTGGAIKLTHLMEDRPHTKEQLAKLHRVRDWLKSEGIYYPEDLNNLL